MIRSRVPIHDGTLFPILPYSSANAQNIRETHTFIPSEGVCSCHTGLPERQMGWLHRQRWRRGFRRVRFWVRFCGSSDTTRCFIAPYLQTQAWCVIRTTHWSWSEDAGGTRHSVTESLPPLA